MELCKIEIPKELLQFLIDSDVIKFSDIKLIAVNDNTDSFKDNEVWKAQKLKSDKEYKKLKEIEFKLIHKIE
jgi:hypothetical protein